LFLIIFGSLTHGKNYVVRRRQRTPYSIEFARRMAKYETLCLITAVSLTQDRHQNNAMNQHRFVQSRRGRRSYDYAKRRPRRDQPFIP